MAMDAWIIFILVGAVSGWLAGVITGGRGFGLIGNIIVGVIGSFVGSYLFKALGIHMDGMQGLVITSVSGASLLLLIASFFKR